MTNKEVRSLNVEVRADDQEGSRKVFGYPIVFGKPSNDIGFIEYIDKGALKGVDLSDVYLVYAHDPNQPLARVDAGTLKLKVDDEGLYFEATLPNTTLANDVLENIRVGNIKGMSFMFTAAEDKWELSNEPGKPDIRHVTKIDEVFEITITPLPAYDDTSIAIASRDAQRANGYSLRQRLQDTVTLALIQQRNGGFNGNTR